MKAKCIFPFIAAAIAIGALASCSIHINKRTDNSEMKTKTFEAKDFDKISINCSADVKYTVADTTCITVTATDDWMNSIDISTADDGTLVISKKEIDDRAIHVNWHSGECQVIIAGPSLQSVVIAGSGSFKCFGEILSTDFLASVAGSGDIDIESIKAENASFVTVGSGDIKISGIEADKLDVSVSGSGDISVHASNVASINANVVGSGDIALDCKDCGTATASISGSGDISLYGNLKNLNQSTAGSGDIDISKLKIGK